MTQLLFFSPRFHLSPRAGIVPLVALVLSGILGCAGGSNPVHGTVTFNGKPIAKGHINFIPVDGKGTPAGGPINNGEYRVVNVTPGKNRVDVSSYTDASTGNMDDAIRAAKTNKQLPADVVAPNDEGNSQSHEIPSGGYELNLTLKTRVNSDGSIR